MSSFSRNALAVDGGSVKIWTKEKSGQRIGRSAGIIPLAMIFEVSQGKSLNF
jgi:hypothetical protein